MFSTQDFVKEGAHFNLLTNTDGDVTFLIPVGEISALEPLPASVLLISLSYTNGFQVISTSSFLHTTHLPTSHIYVKTLAPVLDCFIF